MEEKDIYKQIDSILEKANELDLWIKRYGGYEGVSERLSKADCNLKIALSFLKCLKSKHIDY